MFLVKPAPTENFAQILPAHLVIILYCTGLQYLLINFRDFIYTPLLWDTTVSNLDFTSVHFKDLPDLSNTHYSHSLAQMPSPSAK